MTTTARHRQHRGLLEQGGPAEPSTEETLEVVFPWVVDRALAAGYGEDIESYLGVAAPAYPATEQVRRRGLFGVRLGHRGR